MLGKYLTGDTIELNVPVANWREAIEQAGGLLERRNLIQKEYTNSMIRAVEELGPYIVIMPGIAFAHARPDDSVLEDGLSMITLDTPIEFGHGGNDPVEIVFAIGAKNSGNHVEFIESLANFLDSTENLELIKNCKDKEELLKIINN